MMGPPPNTITVRREHLTLTPNPSPTHNPTHDHSSTHNHNPNHNPNPNPNPTHNPSHNHNPNHDHNPNPDQVRREHLLDDSFAELRGLGSQMRQVSSM
jgi:hypothetical protein